MAYKQDAQTAWILLIPVIILLVIGAIMILSTSSVVGLSSFNNSFYFIKRHTLYLAIGIVAFIFGLKIPHLTYKKYAIWGLLFSVFLLGLTIIPGIGHRALGASRWIHLGFISFQPTEIAKFFIIVFVATSLENKKNNIKYAFTGWIPVLMIVAIPTFFLGLQPDLGSIGVITLAVFTLLFLSGIRLSHLLTLFLIGISMIVVSILKYPYQFQRITAFLSPWEDPTGKSYHTIQSLIAIGSGGFWGLGLGESKLKHSYLPMQYSDFIFSITCEEGGFILAALVLLMFACIFHIGFSIAKQSYQLFSYYLCLGLLMTIMFQSMINIAVVTGVFPVTGIPLTFISFGGTSLMMSMFSIGVILNISKYNTLAHKKEQKGISE